jgi:small subunit ribosomal protein S5
MADQQNSQPKSNSNLRSSAGLAPSNSSHSRYPRSSDRAGAGSNRSNSGAPSQRRFGDRNQSAPGSNPRQGSNDNRSRGRSGGSAGLKRNSRDRRKNEEQENKYDSQIIQVRRVTRVVKGGKRMRFSALVVVGDKQGNVGYGLKKGVDFQESVSKATKQATANMVKITLNDDGTIPFQSQVKYKSTVIMLKPANQGTGLISGGFVRPVLELAGVKNIYSKIIGSNNKVTGVQAVFEAFKKYTK